MGLIFRKRVRTGPRTWLNLSRSGVSASGRTGPLTVNSRGRITMRLGKYFSWRL